MSHRIRNTSSKNKSAAAKRPTEWLKTQHLKPKAADPIQYSSKRTRPTHPIQKQQQQMYVLALPIQYRRSNSSKRTSDRIRNWTMSALPIKKQHSPRPKVQQIQRQNKLVYLLLPSVRQCRRQPLSPRKNHYCYTKSIPATKGSKQPIITGISFTQLGNSKFPSAEECRRMPNPTAGEHRIQRNICTLPLIVGRRLTDSSEAIQNQSTEREKARGSPKFSFSSARMNRDTT